MIVHVHIRALSGTRVPVGYPSVRKKGGYLVPNMDPRVPEEKNKRKKERKFSRTQTLSPSVPCERLFSDAGNTLTKRRVSMKPAMAEMLIFLLLNRKNVKLAE